MGRRKHDILYCPVAVVGDAFAVAIPLHAFDFGIRLKANTLFGEQFTEHISRFAVFRVKDVRASFQDSYFDAEAMEQLGEFDTDSTATCNCHTTRQGWQ